MEVFNLSWLLFQIILLGQLLWITAYPFTETLISYWDASTLTWGSVMTRSANQLLWVGGKIPHLTTLSVAEDCSICHCGLLKGVINCYRIIKHRRLRKQNLWGVYSDSRKLCWRQKEKYEYPGNISKNPRCTACLWMFRVLANIDSDSSCLLRLLCQVIMMEGDYLLCFFFFFLHLCLLQTVNFTVEKKRKKALEIQLNYSVGYREQRIIWG